MVAATFVDPLDVACHTLDMEGLENTPVSSLRLMRFSFEPNEQLLEETKKLVEESRRPSTPIRYYASRQLLLPISEYYQHEGSLQRIGRAFTRRNDPIHVAPVIRSKELTGGVTRYQLLSTQQKAFDELTSLEVRSDTRFDSSALYEYSTTRQLPNEIEQQPGQGHYLFIDIATDALKSEKERRTVENAFVEKAAKDRFLLHTLALSAIRDIHRVIEQPQALLYDTDGDEDQLPIAG